MSALAIVMEALRRHAAGEPANLPRDAARDVVQAYERWRASPAMRLERAFACIDYSRRDSALRRVHELCCDGASHLRAARVITTMAEHLQRSGARPTSDAERVLVDVLRDGPLPGVERLRRILAARPGDSASP